MLIRTQSWLNAVTLVSLRDSKVNLSHVNLAESMRYWNALIITLGPGAGFSFIALNSYATNVKVTNASSSAKGYACQQEKIDELNPPLPPSSFVLYVILRTSALRAPGWSVGLSLGLPPSTGRKARDSREMLLLQPGELDDWS